MKSDNPQSTEFVLLGNYLPQDAKRLLDRFEQAGIAFRTRPRRPFPQPGPPTTLAISVDSARSSEVRQILRDLFGEYLPNYDSSFFREHGNV